MTDAPHHVVIIGGGFGGLTAARSLKDANLRITLVDKRNFHLFQPLLYQVATGLLCPSEITAPLRHVLKNQKNAETLLGEVVDIDVKGRRVILNDGEIGYDTLVVAAGMLNHYHGHDEWERHAPGLKTIEDTGRIRQRIFSAFEIAEREPDPEARREWLTFAVIGSGPTGIEISGMISEIAHNTLKDEFRAIHPEEARILLLDASDRILPAYPRGLSNLTEKSLNKLGIETVTHTRVVEVNEQGILVEKPEGRAFIRARTVVWASGVTASPLGKIIAHATGASLDKTGRVVTSQDLSLEGHPEIFVIGDLASFPGKDGSPLPGLAPAATQQGRFAARVIRARVEGRRAPARFRYFDKGTMAVIGRGSAVADIGRWHFGGRFAWFLWLFIHLALLIKFQNRIIVLIRWAFQYFTYNRGARNLMLRGPLKLPLTRAGGPLGPGA